jgi:uncharacterized BrkB/YihY/UPF0761 family membrane protein
MANVIFHGTKTMTKHEKLILLLVFLLLLGRFGGLARDLYVARTYGSPTPEYVKYYAEQVSVIFGVLVNIGAAIWLYIEAKSVELKAWVWSVLGFFFGVMGIIMFYVIQIYSTKRNNEI